MNNKKDESNLTKMHIVDTAMNLFRQRGYYNVSVTDICKASKFQEAPFIITLSQKTKSLTAFFET